MTKEFGTCQKCGVEFQKRAAHSKFCSHKCYWTSGINRRGSRTVTKHGYVMLTIWEEGAAKPRMVFEHRLIMERSLGRRLSADEDVHHVNGIKDDNRLENLQVMSHAEHSSETHTKRKRRRGYKLKITPDGMRRRIEAARRRHAAERAMSADRRSRADVECSRTA